MRRLTMALMLCGVVGCGPGIEQAKRALATASNGPAAAHAPAELALATGQLRLAEAEKDDDTRRTHLREVIRLAGEATRLGQERSARAKAEGNIVREKAAGRREQVQQASKVIDERGAPVREGPATAPVRQWSAEALEDALTLGSPLFVIDVGDDRRCERAHVMGAHCMPASHVATLELPRDREVVVMGDGERPDEARVDEAILALQKRGYTTVGVMRGGMKEWRADARAWVGAERAMPGGLRAFDLDQMEAVMGKKGEQAWLLVDARPVALYRAGHLAGALHAPIDELEKRVAALPTGTRVIVYAADDSASLEAGRRAATVEGRGVAFLVGGVRAAVMAGIPLEAGNQDIKVAQGGGR